MKIKGILILLAFAACLTATSSVTATAATKRAALTTQKSAGITAGPAAPTTILVDNNATGRCPGASQTSINAAIALVAPGGTVNVCPGTYNEQVVIRKSLTLQGVEVFNHDLTVIQPGAVTANTTKVHSDPTIPDNPLAAVILVDGTTSTSGKIYVTLNNLTVDGSAAGPFSGCGTEFAGIFYRNADGFIYNDVVKNIQLGGTLKGCQTGLGILQESGTDPAATGQTNTTSNVLMVGNTVHDYQKNGITVTETGSNASIETNFAQGDGVGGSYSAVIAQNGIELGFGATGDISYNFVKNNLYTPCVSVTSCIASATGILVVNSDSILLKANFVSGNQGNIVTTGSGPGGHSNNNDIENTASLEALVYDGIAVIGDGNKVNANNIYKSDESGVYFAGNNNNISNNTIAETHSGILDQSPNGSSGNNTGANDPNYPKSKNGNIFYTTFIEYDGITPAKAAPGQKGLMVSRGSLSTHQPRVIAPPWR